MLSATNGTLIHTTMTPATVKKDSGSASQLCPWAPSTPSWTRAQLSRPRRQSTIQIHTVIAATTGIAHATRSATWSTTRGQVSRAFIRTAMAPPMATVTTAVTTQKTTDRTTTVHRYGSVTSEV